MIFLGEALAPTALALDAMVGWPAGIYARIGHPVGGFARIIERCAARWNHPSWSAQKRRAMGVVTLVLLLLVAGGIAGLIRLGGTMLAALAAWPALAQRSLHAHVTAVAEALDAGDLPRARRAVAAIVGRDTAGLDEESVARAAIESLAESFGDGVVAPAFWLLVGGLPGVWSYKAVNTADSLIGHREAPWGPFGWAAARADDMLNWLPARLTGCLIACVGGGWRVMWRDSRVHASPNAGWSEAAMAGALGVRLGGPVHYDGIAAPRGWIGDGGAPDRAQLWRALALYRRACGLLWLMVLAIFVLGVAGFRWLR